MVLTTARDCKVLALFSSCRRCAQQEDDLEVMAQRLTSLTQQCITLEKENTHLQVEHRRTGDKDLKINTHVMAEICTSRKLFLTSSDGPCFKD